MVLLRVGHSNQIRWKSFLRLAMPLAAVVGFFTTYSPLLGWLVLLPGSIALAIHLYRRHQPGPLTTSQGAKLGALLAFLNFAILAIILGVMVAHDPVGYRHDVEKAFQDRFAHNPNPQAEEIAKNILNSPSGIAFFTILGMALMLGLLLLIGGVSGALVVGMTRSRPGP